MKLLPPKGAGLKALLPLPARQFSVQPLGESGLFQVNAQSPKRKEAQAMADTLAQVYVKAAQDRSRAAARSARHYIEGQLLTAQTEYSRALQQLNGFKKQHQTVNLEEETKAGVAQMVELLAGREDTIEEIREARDQLNTAVRQLRAVAPTQVSAWTEVDNPHVVKLKDQLMALQSELYGLRTRYTEDSSRVKELRQQIASLEAQLAQEQTKPRSFGSETKAINPLHQDLVKQVQDAERKQAVAEGKLRLENRLVEKYMARMGTLPDKELELAKLTFAVTTAEEAYRLLKDSLYRIRIQEAMQISNISQVEPAALPLKPVRPQPLMNALLGAFFGVVLGLFLAFLVEYLDDTVKSVDNARQWSTFPELAVIPRFPKRHSPLVTRFGPRSPVVEAYHTLRSNIRLSSPDRPVKCLMITSSVPREGKTVTATNLALTCAAAGQRVLLVDADLRHSQLHELLEHPNHQGLTNVLAGEADLAEVVGEVNLAQRMEPARSREEGSLWLLSAGPVPPDPGRMLESQRMKEMVEELREQYDLIIFDTPPVLPVNDPNILAPLMDGVLVVARAGLATRHALQLAAETLGRVPAPVLGVVVNAYTPAGRHGYYYGYYYSHYYPKEGDGQPQSGEGLDQEEGPPQNFHYT
jgi:capsular exopolysaccharide synthesis family protein